MNPTVLDLFAGCGGLSYGFQEAGYNIIGFVEKWEPAIETFLKNHPSTIHLGGDIQKIRDHELLKYKDKVDVIVGGPPCQGFSMCGKRDPADPRNRLYREYLRFVRIIRPKAIVMENVQGLRTMKTQQGEYVLAKILYDLIDLGYCVSYKVLTASDHGVPQKRRRLVIVGIRRELFPTPDERMITVGEALRSISTHQNGQVFFETTSASNERFSKLKQGERVNSPFNFCRQRLSASEPSRTITTVPMYIHPTEDRLLTPRELARLQSFPDDFKFCGTKTSMVKQIGNAVPPRLAYKIAEQLRGEIQ